MYTTWSLRGFRNQGGRGANDVIVTEVIPRSLLHHFVSRPEVSKPRRYSIINPRRACAARVTVLSLSVCVCVCVCVSVTSLTATPLTHRYKVRYESNANALLKVFDSWISLKILCSKVTALFAHLNEL